MTNASTYQHNFARLVEIKTGSVELEFLPDPSKWPWLQLPAAHPIIAEKYSYFGSMTASWALGLFEPDDFTALRQFEWSCPALPVDAPHAERGLCRGENGHSGLGFEVDVFGPDNQLYYQMSGQGFVFKDRDFRAWRQSSRNTVLQSTRQRAIEFCHPAAAAAPAGAPSLVSQALDDHRVLGLLKSQQSFYPQHPYHTGSGDHVNAAQLLDCLLQAAHVLLGGGEHWTAARSCLGGKISFQRYVELDAPFEIHCLNSSKGTMDFSISQADRENLQATLYLA